MLLISEENERQAKVFADEYREKRYGKNVLGVDEETFYKFIYFGKLGELVFRDYLVSQGVPHECKDILVPYPGLYKREGSDFTLILTGETVDVKTVEEDYKIRLLVREDQFKARQHDVYVGQRVTNDRKYVECWGYITGKDLAKKDVSEKFGFGPCRAALLSELVPITEFVRLAKAGTNFR